MMKLEYVCLSDLHFGEEHSLLTDIELINNKWQTVPSKCSPVMEGLFGLLTELKRQANQNEPIEHLVLMGDILDLALGKLSDSSKILHLFLKNIKEKDLFKKIIYLPGNHDHHIWEQAREKAFEDRILSDPAGNCTIPEEFHTLNLDEPNVNCPLLDTIAKACGLDSIEVRYPLLRIPFDGVNQPINRQIFIHHGHLHEDTYLLMSRAMELFFGKKMPIKIDELEEENHAWIDFLWSTLGRSGKVGAETEVIYESLGKKEKMENLVDQVAKALAGKFEFLPDILPLEEKAEQVSLKYLIKEVIKAIGRERPVVDEPLTRKASESLKKFLDDVLHDYLGNTNVDKWRDYQTTYIFGHTHKPINNGNMDSRDFRSIKLFNTGGWVVEQTDKPSTVHGAAITVLNEIGEVGHVHLYSQTEELQGPDFPRIFGDHGMKQVLSNAISGNVADDFIRKVRRAIAIRIEKPEK